MPLPANSISIPTFSPRIGIITAITQAKFPFITTLTPHTFVTGQIVKFIIPGPERATSQQPAFNYGMPEINGLTGTVIFTSSGTPNLFSIDLDTRFFQPFTLPAAASQLAQVTSVGELNSQLFGAERNILGPPSPFGGENVP